MDGSQVVTSFAIFVDGEIVCGGGFAVAQAPGTNTFVSNDGGVFSFRHAYREATCQLDISYPGSSGGEHRIALAVPINRSRVKWKRAALGGKYELFYRSSFEFHRETRELRKIRRQASIARRDRPSPVNLIRVDPGNGEEDA